MQFEIYFVARGKDGKPDKLKVKMLLNCAGPEAIEENSHFVYNEGEEKESYADVYWSLVTGHFFGDNLRNGLFEHTCVFFFRFLCIFLGCEFCYM